MASDINSILDDKIIRDLEKTNDLIIKNANSIDSKLLPAINKLQSTQKELGKTTKTNSDERKKLTESEKEAQKIAKQLESTEAKINALNDKSVQKLLAKRTELQNNTKAAKDLQRAQLAQRGSTEQLTAVNIILEKRLRNVNQTTAEGKKKADLLRSAIDKNNQKITQQSSALTAQKRGIGGYASGIKEAAAQSGIFSRELTIITKVQTTLTAVLGQKAKAQTAANAATNFGTKAMKIFKIALASTGIGLLVVALGSLVSFFKATEEGAASLQKILSPFKILFGNLSDLLVRIGGAMVDAFNNPREAVLNLWQAIKTNIVNRITGLIDTFKFFGKVIKAAIDLDFDAVKENAKLAGESIVQSATGIDDAFGKAKRAVTGLIEETKKENEQNKQIIDGRLALIKREREAKLELAKLEVSIQEFRLKLKDKENLSDAERLEFAEKAQEAINKQGAIETELASKRLEFRRLENSFSASSQEDLDKEAELEVALFNIQSTNAKNLIRIESEKQAIIKAINAERLKDEKALLDSIEADLDAQIESEIEAEQNKLNKELEINIEYNSSLLEQTKNRLSEEEQLEIEANEKRRQRNDEAARQAIAITNALFNFRMTKLDAELQAVEGNAEKEKEIKRKQAQTAKVQALFNIAIGTAENIIKAGLDPFLIGLATTLGIIQAGVVLAQPIPQFAKGTNYAPGGVSELAERGREMVQNPDGTVWMAQNRGLYNLERGSRVLTNQKTESVLSDGNIVNELRATRKAIKNIPQPINRNGSKIAERRDKMYIDYRISKYRLN